MASFAQPTPVIDASNLSPVTITNLAVDKYIIRPNDTVEVKVYQEDDLNTQATVTQGGTVALPLLGEVIVGGKTVEEARQLIHDLLQRDYLYHPQVTLTVTEYSKTKFVVLGQIMRPGYYEIPVGEKINLLQVIAMAGGYTRIAAPSRILIKRTVNNREFVYKVNTKTMARDEDTEIMEIKPGDTIIVGESIF